MSKPILTIEDLELEGDIREDIDSWMKSMKGTTIKSNSGEISSARRDFLRHGDVELDDIEFV